MAEHRFPIADFRGVVYHDAPLLERTTWRMGGPARWLVQPMDEKALSNLWTTLPGEIPRIVLGCGSNILVEDDGFDGVVIDLTRSFKAIRLVQTQEESAIIHADAGLSVRALAHFARKQGLSGAEFLAGIPGTVGGALLMNAGAHGAEIKDILLDADLLDPQGECQRMPVEELGLCYRHSQTRPGWLFLSARFQLGKSDPEAIRKKICTFNQYRRHSQPLDFPSAGSTFKNPKEGPHAWRLIDAAGMRGASCGDAHVSEKHCNFLVNRGRARADDMLKLMERVQEAVFAVSGIHLDREVAVLGRTGLRNRHFASSF